MCVKSSCIYTKKSLIINTKIMSEIVSLEIKCSVNSQYNQK